MAELGLFKAILGLKKAELELFGGNIQPLVKYLQKQEVLFESLRIKIPPR